MRRCAVLACALLLGCGAQAPAESPRPQAEATVLTRASEPLPPPEWGHGLSDRACLECHDEVAADWVGSRHQRAFVNQDFQDSYRREPLDFCRDCHAPRRQLVGDAEAERHGVGCVSCHVREGRVWTGPGAGQADTAPHDVFRDAAFGTDSCADCHEFEFPRGLGRHPPGARMQLTMTEHAASPLADVSCGDCHLPRREGRRVHGMARSRDLGAIRGALAVRSARAGPGAVELELEPIAVGHAFPTGDLFRRLAVTVEARSPDGRLSHVETRYLARHFPTERHLDGSLNPAALRPTPDDRPRGRSHVRIDLPDVGPADRLTWAVDYERVDVRDSRRPEQSTLASGVRLAEGSF